MNNVKDYLEKKEWDIAIAITNSLPEKEKRDCINIIVNHCLELTPEATSEILAKLKIEWPKYFVKMYFETNLEYIEDYNILVVIKNCSRKEKSDYLQLLFDYMVKKNKMAEAEKIALLMQPKSKNKAFSVILQKCYMNGSWIDDPSSVEKNLGRKLTENELEKMLKNAISTGRLYACRLIAKRLKRPLSFDNLNNILEVVLASKNDDVEKVLDIVKLIPFQNLTESLWINIYKRCLSNVKNYKFLINLVKIYRIKEAAKIQPSINYLFEKTATKTYPEEMEIIANVLVKLFKIVKVKERDDILENIFLRYYDSSPYWQYNLFDASIILISGMSKSKKMFYSKKIFLDQVNDLSNHYGDPEKKKIVIRTIESINLMEKDGNIFLQNLLISYEKENDIDKMRFVAKLITGEIKAKR